MTATEADAKQSEESANNNANANANAADADAGGGGKKQLQSELQAKLEAIRAARNFNAKVWIENTCTQFNEYMANAKLSACCVSLSGGVDSACTLGLMKYASKMPNSPIKRVLAIAQPVHSSAWAKNRAIECAEAMGAEIVTLDQTAIFDQIKALIDKQLNIEGGQFAGGQLRSYIRTPSAYYVAQLLSQNGTPCLVMGTGNKDEDHYLAYFCKAGDGVVDVQLLAGIHKSEVFTASAELGAPQSILVAAPSADLWDGQEDEDELGFTYDFIELWINYVEMTEVKQKEFRTGLCQEALDQLDAWGAKATAVHNRNKHKLSSPFNIIAAVN